MDLVDRLFSPLAAIGLVGAALVGFLLGSQRESAPAGSAAPPAAVTLRRSLDTSRVTLEAPAGWQSVAASNVVPGLALTHVQALAPTGESGSQLQIGELAQGPPSPLPPSLVATLSGRPLAEVVQLPQAEAFRYTNLTIAGYGGLLTLYALPVPGEGATIVACQAPARAVSFIRECEEAAATVRPVSAAGVINLTPNAAYGSALTTTVAWLEQRRAKLRARMHGAPSASPARALAAAFSHTAATLSHLEPPAPAGDAQAALVTSLLANAGAYRTLASSVGETSAYEAARGQVGTAETATNSALATYALLGYRLSR